MSESEHTPKFSNRLIHETSPYLLQHAYNPVAWYPWGAEALERAKQEDKLILLSIGYSACHWCHVMERESFEDEAIAALMNEQFINIKVDREERPDVDEIYMSATVAMNRGQGGWPMTVFLTPGLEPVFAGTYFPPDDMYGRPGFRSVLREVARAWREDREALRQRAQEFADQLRTRRSAGPPLAVGERELREALEGYAREFDSEYGGFGVAPKFPPAVGLSLLLRLHRRFSDPRALNMVRKTLEAMARGGMYDHIGGGFARYSTDRRWLVPHFEKMLYDNALLAKAYLEGYQATGDPQFRRVAVETLDYVLREMTDSQGGFYSSTDADSEGEEGKFFVWKPEQVERVLGDREDARRFCAYYDITLAGNWEGKSIPNTPRTMSAVAEDLGVAADELERTLTLSRTKMYAARENRVKPGLDDKILTAWNGLMIGAMAEGHRVLRDRRYLEAAERAANFALGTLSRDDGGLLRTYRAGKAHLNAYLEDYTYLAEGLLDLYEAGGSLHWLREAERLLQRTLHDFSDEASGAFYNTARDHERLIMRYQDGADGATPAANAVAASTLVRLSYHLDRPAWRSAAARAIKAYGSLISRYPRGFAKSLCLVDFLLEGPVELAFVGRRGQQGLEILQREVARHHLPNRIQAILHTDARDGAEGLPLLQGKTLVEGEAALYVCRNFACQAPLTDAKDIAAQLASACVSSVAKTIAVRLAGRATPDGTASHAARVAPHGCVSLGATGLTASRLGFGGYRTHDRTPEHREALTLALRSGINLIDTSTNYTDGASERLVGSVLHELIDADELSREQVIVVSKIGYLQGTNLELARERERAGDGYPEMVKLEEGLWHCIHPSFLQEQLESSLDRLELETLDFCLLHNPEYFLSDAARRGQSLESARQEFYRRVGQAFHYLESQVGEGRLGGYGVSSNTVVAPAAQNEAISFTRLLEAAWKACGEAHHFQLLQLPLNLLEPAAVSERNCGSDSSQTVLEAAAAMEIAVLVNRPLNAIDNGALFRLADSAVEAGATAVEQNIERLEEMEVRFSLEIAPLLRISGLQDPEQLFDLAKRLRRIQPAISGLAQWDQIDMQIRYSVSAIAAMLDKKLEEEVPETWTAWRDAYLPELEEALRELRRGAAEKQRARALEIAGKIDPNLPPERREASLSRKALWVLTSTPGVACVLNGMRRPQYVEDSVEVLRWPPLENAAAVYRATERLSS